MTISFAQWRRSVQGRYIDVDGAFGGQCWDIAQDYATRVVNPVITMWTNRGAHPGYAVGIVESFWKTDLNVFFTLHNGNTTAQRGDIVVWAYGQAMYPISHVAVVVADRGANVLTLSQNSSPARPDLPGYSSMASGPTILQTLPKAQCWYLRPKPSQWWSPGAQPNPNAGAVGAKEEEDPMPQQKNINNESGYQTRLKAGKWKTVGIDKGRVSILGEKKRWQATVSLKISGVKQGEDLKVRFVKVGWNGKKSTYTRSYGTNDYVATSGGDYLLQTTLGDLDANERLRIQVLTYSEGAKVERWNARIHHWDK